MVSYFLIPPFQLAFKIQHFVFHLWHSTLKPV